MSQDNKVIGFISQAELTALMRETGLIAIQDTANADGKPVIHALLKVVNAQTGAELPGGLPFSVVMFKRAAEAGYSSVAIGTVVPAAELGIELPADFFTLCNQRFRFIRAYPLDASAFVLQMDLIVRGTTVEYIKFAFGLWTSMFSQVLFELMAHGHDAVSRAAEIYARVPVSFIAPELDQTVGEPAVEAPIVAPQEAPDAAGETAEAPVPAEQVAAEVAEATAPAAAEKASAAPAAETESATEPATKQTTEPPAAEAETKPEAAAEKTEESTPVEAAPAEKAAEPAMA